MSDDAPTTEPDLLKHGFLTTPRMSAKHLDAVSRRLFALTEPPEFRNDGSVVIRKPVALRDTGSVGYHHIRKGGALYLLLPKPVVRECVGSPCESCPHWGLCFVDQIPFARIFRCKIKPHHYKKRCQYYEGRWKPAGTEILSLTLHETGSPSKLIMRKFMREQLFPETRKDVTKRGTSTSDVRDTEAPGPP